MSFVGSAAFFAVWLLAIGILFLVASFREPARDKGVLQMKRLLFLFAIGYIVLSHYAVLIAIGQSLDENYEAPCEWKINKTTELYKYGNNFTGYHWDYDAGTAPDGPQTDAYLFHKNTTYTYFDTCATRTAPEGSSALVVIFTWMLFVLAFASVFAVIIYLVNVARRFV